MNQVTIRKATLDDVPVLGLLARVTFREAFGHLFIENQNLLDYFDKTFSFDALTDKIKDKNNVFWLAFYDRLPVAYAKIIINAPSKFIEDPKVSELQRIYVLNDFLNKKIGHELLNVVFDEIKTIRSKHLWLSVYVDNLKAIRFYEKYNFKIIGKHTFGILKQSFEFYVMDKEFS